MGTNYYWTSKPCANPCEHCEGGERLHIGKSSGGWCFALHVIPEQGINSLSDWEERFWQPGSQITGGGSTLSAEEMVRTITDRSWIRKTVPFGYTDWDDFHAKNYSVFGPNGLVRCRLSPLCVGHGDGTWDLIPGEFS